MQLSGHKSFILGRQHLAFFGVQLILIKRGMGRNVRHICRLLQQLTQDLELLCCCLASCSSPRRNFLLQFEWGSLIKSLKSRAFAQYAPLPSLQSTITCNLFTHNEGASDLSRLSVAAFVWTVTELAFFSLFCYDFRRCKGGHACFHSFKWLNNWWMTGA